MITFHAPIGNFADAIWNFIAKLELPIPLNFGDSRNLLPHYAKDGVFTIGAGFNLTTGNIRGQTTVSKGDKRRRQAAER